MTLDPKDPRLDQPLSSFSLVEAVNVAKAMVHPDFASFVTPATIKSTHEHPVRSGYPIRICKNYFERAAKAEKKKLDMSTWDVYFLGARDILTAKTNYDVARVNGQRALLYRIDTGQLAEATIWGTGPGDEGAKQTLPFWHTLSTKVEENEFTRQSGETDVGYTMSYLDRAEPLSPESIISLILNLALTPSALDRETHLYKPVVLVGKLGSFKPIEEWEETGELVAVQDADGNPVPDPKTGQVKMKAERQPTAEGQPFVQTRIDDPNQSIFTFQANLSPIDEEDKSENRVRFRFLNKKLGNHFVDLPLINQIFTDAVAMGIGTSEDAVEHLTGTYAGTEVLVVGVITRFYSDEERDLNWIDMEATLCIPLDGSQVGTVEQVVTTQAPPAAPQPAPPEYEPEKAIASDAGTVIPTIIAETAPVAPAVSAPTPAPAVVPKAESTSITVDQLKAIVLEGRELYGPSISISELESLRIMPQYMVGQDGKILSDHIKLVNHVIGVVSKEKGDSPVGAAGSVGAPITPLPVVEPVPGAAAPTMEKIICNKCKSPLEPSEVLSHNESCPGAPAE